MYQFRFASFLHRKKYLVQIFYAVCLYPNAFSFLIFIHACKTLATTDNPPSVLIWKYNSMFFGSACFSKWFDRLYRFKFSIDFLKILIRSLYDMFSAKCRYSIRIHRLLAQILQQRIALTTSKRAQNFRHGNHLVWTESSSSFVAEGTEDSEEAEDAGTNHQRANLP